MYHIIKRGVESTPSKNITVTTVAIEGVFDAFSESVVIIQIYHNSANEGE